MEPKRGRIALFTSGPENTHFVERVTDGERFVLAFWFTCMPSKQFEIFLDGKAHLKFSNKVAQKLRDQMASEDDDSDQQ